MHREATSKITKAIVDSLVEVDPPPKLATEPQPKPRNLSLAESIKRASANASSLVQHIHEQEHAREMDAWVRKHAFIDASQMQGGHTQRRKGLRRGVEQVYCR